MKRTFVLRLFTLTLLLVILASMCPSLTLTMVPLVWFEEIQDPITVTAVDEKTLVEFTTAVILRRQSPKNLPPTLTADHQLRILFLSVSDGKTAAQVAMGTGHGIGKALQQALVNIQTQLKPGYQPQWLKVDIVRRVFPLAQVDLSQPLQMERSLYGLAFDRQSGIAFLPEQLMTGLVSPEHFLRSDRVINYLGQQPEKLKAYQKLLNSNPMKGYRFTTSSFFSDGNQVVRLYRGNRLFDQVSQQDLLSAVRSAGQYLTHAVEADGKFVYIYQPETATIPQKYNILRHAGTIYAMLELYKVTRDTQLLQAAQRAIQYLLRSLHLCPTNRGRLTCVVEDGYTKLGGNALAVIALAKYTEVTQDRQYQPIIFQLGKWIQSAQSQSGEFIIHKQSYLGGESEADDFVSEYYPGEAILAMTHLYALDADKKWLNSAEAGAFYLINERDADSPDSQLIHDHWLLYALNRLYRYRPNTQYLNHALRIANAIIQSQHRHPPYPDWLGGFSRPPRSTPTATRTEGLYAAYQLMRDFGDQQSAERILEAIQLGVGFQLRTQFRPESVLYFHNPQRSIGGFHQGLTNLEIRIDYVQHNLSSLLGFYQITRTRR